MGKFGFDPPGNLFVPDIDVGFTALSGNLFPVFGFDRTVGYSQTCQGLGSWLGSQVCTFFVIVGGEKRPTVTLDSGLWVRQFCSGVGRRVFECCTFIGRG